MMAGRAASVLALLLGVFVALVAVPATHARPQEGIIKPPMPSDTFLNISDAIANAANAFESPISEGVVPFYAQPSEDSCAICEHILSRSNVAEALSPEAAANLADEACSAIERDTTRWQCRGIAANYIDDLINGHCNTACADVKRERRSVCQSHVECLTTQFCGQNQECQACSVCAMEGVDVALGGYCPCLGGTIEGITPAEGSTVVGGTLQTIEFKTENVGPAVNIELYKRGENTKAFRTIQQFVRVSDTGVTKFTWPVSRYYPSGSYYITITSIASSQIVGLVPTNGYFQIQKSLACKAHEVCSATTYCDIYSSCYYCDECERWQDAFDGQCPEKCYKSIATRAQVTFQLPKATSKIATNSYLPIVWNYNALVLDHIDLYLLPVNSFNSLLALSINQEVSAGSLAYKVPRDFPPGKYWIVATHTADASLQVIGYTPDRANTIGDTGFEIFQEDCPSHDSCEDTEYCDADGSCYPCDDCFRTGAAFDGTCPQKCGTGTVMEFGTSIPDGPEADASGVILEFILPQCPEFKALQHLTATETVKPDPPTSNGDPSVMSKRLRRHITTLASVVRGVFGDDAYVRVLEAYVEPPADISKASLHNVGRAARITIEGVPDDFASDRLGVLGGLAVEAGFDYVAYTSRDSLYVSVIADQCRQNLDLVFLLDGSGSIESTALGGAPGTFQDRVLAFVSQVTTYFTIGEHDTRVAVATFASGATVNIRLNDHFDGDALRDAIADIPYPQGQTYTSLGLRAVRQDILTEANGMRPASEGVPRVLVVLTDGNSQPSYDPATEASILHDQNVNVFAIGVGSSISQSQLEDIASDPDARHVFNLRSFSLIGDIVDAMSATTCDAPAVLTAGDSVSSVVRPCETLFFRPLCGQITNLNIELKSERGAAVMYVAFNNQHPSPFDYDFAVTGTDELKRLTLNRSPDDTDPVYIAVQANVPAASADDEDAALAGVDFVLTVYSDIFPGVADTVVQVAEDRPVGTVIFTPPATQLADPQPVFEFSLVGRTDEQFSIDATTGAVSIARPLDHELVSSYRLRISARAIGLPCLTGAIDIVVSVIDVNDNAPVFAQSLYQVAVDEGRPRNTLVLQVQATDADSGANAMIVYSLATQNVPFAIDGASGVIVTTEVLNNDVQQEYQLAVVASDGVRSATAKVYVTVNPVPCPLGTASATGTLPCVACPDGTFQDGSAPVADTCFPCGCGEGEYATGSCTPKHNYDCRSCPVYSYSEAGSIQLSDCECKDGYFKIEDEGTNTFFCAPCTEQCPAGSYQTAACSPKHDIECAQCTSTCPSGHFLSGTCGGTSNYECTPCATCQAGQFISSPCQVTGNRECSACTTYADCEQGTEYIDGLCTMGTDTSSPSCQPCIDTCAPGAFLTGECGGADGTSRTRCQQCTVCTTSQYLVSDCTDDADRQCADCVTECDAGSYLVGECNPMSTDAPRCEPCTTEEDCEDNEYLDNGVCGGSSTPECQTCHPSCLACDGPGPESCTDCPSGTSLHEGACLSECPLGTYSVDGECQACSSNCLTCNGTSDTCTSCDTAASLVLHDSECVSVCPDGFFKDFAGGVCRRCKTCSGGTYKVGGCQGATNTQCEPWSAECVPGVSFESVTPTPSNDRECTMCKTSCPAGEQLTGECITEDRTCVPCPSGTYKEAAGGQACVPCPTSCAQNEYLDGTCTVTTSTVCRACTTECENDIYLSGTCNGTRSYPTCEECSTCGEDQYVLRACSSANGGSNTVCRDCTQTCPEGHYMSSPCSANADAVCTPCTTADACLSTEVLIGTCGGTETTQCVPCHPECLTCSGPSASNCTSCERGVFLSGTECRTECDLGFYPSTASGECELCHPSCRDCVGATSTACTSCNSPLFLLGTECVAGCPTGYFGDTTSQTCRQCRQCPTGTYKTGGCDGTQDTVCTMWTPCAVGEYEVVSPTAFRDRECAACRQSCPAGSELVGECGGPEGTSNPSCEPCDAGFFKEEPGAGSCQACRTSCEAGSFLTGQCSTTTQPTCQLCKSSCGPDHYLTGVCEGRQDFTCEACNTCEEGEYEVAPCLGSGQNRQCATCRTSCPAGQFLTGMCQGTTQPQCMSCRTQEDCAENEFVSGECGGADGRQNPTCESCDGSCARCDGSAPTDCVACSGSLSLDTDTGRCVSDCSAGTYAADNVCEDCDPSCAACFGGASTECTACFPDTFLSNGRCVATCPQGTFANATTGRCQTCSQCPSGTFVEAACTTTSNTVCTAWTECAPGTYQSTAPTTTSDRVCSTCTTTCPAGQELSVSCTPTHNAQCTACNAGTYKPSSGPQACQACVQSCSEGYYVSGTCTATSTPTCILCTSTCAEGFFLQGECAGSSNPHCEACDTCDIGKYETRACTLNSDRQCSACTTPDACAQGEYLDGECTPTSNPRCKPCTTTSQCGADQFLAGECAADAPNPTCTTCTTCAGDEYEAAPCTETSDRQCAKCTDACPNGHFLTGACPGSLAADFPRTVVVDGVTYAALDATFPEDTSTSCQAQASLPSGWSLVTNVDVARDVAAQHPWGASCLVVSAEHAFATANSATLSPGDACHCDEQLGCMTSSSSGLLGVTACPRRILMQWAPPACQQCTSSCPDNHFLDGECGGRSNPVCRPCTVCEEGFYETVACTHLDVGTQDRVCEPCVTEDDCAEGEYLSGMCGGTSTPTCQACTDSCQAGFFLSGTCGGTSNPVCTQCSPCAEGDSFEVSACSATADTQCQSCTTSSDCDLNQYLSQPCTLSTDGVCTRCTQVGDCDSGFYLDGVCTETQDASCQPCHPSCTECEDGTAQGCTACPETLALDRIGFGNVGSCVSSCPPGQAEDVAANTCENCDSSCATCSAPGDATKCTSCTGVLFLTPSGTCSSSCPAGMYGNATTNTCVSCTACDTSSSYESSPCGGTDNRVCSDLTMCPPGTHVIQQPTATSDRRCGDCGEGTYQPASNQAICIVWAECHPQEQYESVAPTSTSNRVCTDLTECTPGAEFQLTAPTETSDRVCKALTTCKANQWQSMAPTATTDRQCTNLTVCAATEYQSMAPTDTSDRQCEPITQCQAHEYEKTAATPFSDAVCEAIRNCTQNEYQTQAPTATSNRACAPLTTCDFETQYISTPATPTSNRVCSALRSCFQHEFESQPPTTTTNRACTECAMCGSTQYERADCTANTNRVCEDLTQCKASQFEAVLATLTSDRECSNCTVCGDNSYTVSPCSNVADTVCDGCTTCPMGSFAAAACTATSDTDCQACATCDAGFFVSSPCTQGSNTQCTRCTTCQPDEYQQVACSASADALCQTITNCTQSQYQVSAPTATTNRVCSAVRECTAGQEYETQAPTATSNRACAPLTTCDFETQFESQAPTATSNRVCTPLSSCDAETQYETQAPTQTSDRECEGLATCVAGEFVATQPTPTSNRVCASCPAGTTDHDSDSETACVACPAGHFSSAGSIGPCSLYMCPAGTADTDNSASTPCEACDGTSSFQPAAGQAACLQATTCVAGEEEQDAPTAVSNRECRPCQLGVTYKAQPGQNTTCAAVRTCLAGEEQTLAPTLSSNRVCTTCGPGTFKAAAGQATSCIATQNCAPGFQESVVPTPASDRQCEACPTGTFKSTTGQATCTAHATCDTDTQYQTKAPTTSTNRECGPLTDCGTGEWEERAPTATSDRVCELCDSCEDEGLTQATACTETANTVCENCDTCSPGFFVSSPCTSVSQTECMECAECGADQYQTQECRVSTNTQCTPLTTCTASQYETVAPTDTSDRECAALTTCVVGQYECVVPTETSNRQCCAIAQCDVGEEEAVAPTATSNRQCQNCTAGTTDDDANGATPCVQCPAGTFVPEGRTGDCSAYRCAPGTVDADQLPSTACTPCSSGVSFAPTSGLTACVAVSDCPAGEEESVQPTLSSDRVCTVCAAGTFKEDAGQDDCMTASTCASGTQYVAQPHTPTSNTVCANVTQCTATQYQTVAPTTMSDRQCRNLTVCEANEYETRAPTATTDRQCATVRAACSMDEFESAAPTATSDRECTQLTTCRAQQYEARAPTPSTDRECIYWTNCTAAQFQVTAPTSVSDRVCANLTVCTATQFEAVAPTTTTNRVCEACTDCPGGTHYEMTPCTASADATCAMCSTCSGDTYASAACSETDDTTCTACTQCVDGSTFESSPCLAHDDRVCLPCTVCNVTEYIEQTCSATSDTQCLPYTTCDLDQFESQEPTRFQDRVCTQHTMCTPDVQYEIVAPTATTDRQCDDLSTCTAQQYISTAHTATSDRVCSALRQCTSSEFELVAPTTTSNRVCQRLTVCDPETEYESVPAGPARDRVCAPLTVCSPLEYESVAPTPTSNRQCEEQVLPPLSPLAIFSASGGLALTSETTYAESTSAQTAVLLQGTTNGEEGTGPVFSASVGEASTSASLETTRPAPAAVRFELAAAGTIYEDDPWVRGVLQVSTPANVVPRATAMDVTVRLDAENATSVSCTTNAHGLCSFALRVPRGWYTPGVDATANVTFAFQEAALQGAVAVQGQSSRLVTLASSAVFVPDNDVYVRLPNRDVRAGETLELEVLSRTAFPIASFAAVVTTSDDSRLRVNSLGLDFASWTGTSKAPSTTSAAVLGIASASARLSGPAGGDQLLFTISVSVPASATPGQASIDIILHSLDNAKGEGIRPGDRALPARVVFVDRQGADATNQGVVTVSGAQSQSIFAAPVSTLLAYTPTISGVAALHHVELFTMRESGGLEALDAADVTCSSSHPAVVDVTPTCHLKLGASSDLNAYAATITVTLDADAGVTTAFDVRVLRPALPVQLTVDDAELNAVTGWLDESSNCRQLYQKTRVRAFTSFSDDSGLVVDNIDVTKYVTMHVSNDGVATLSTPTHAGHDFAGVYVQGFQPGTVQVSTTVQGLASSVSVVVSSTPVVATRLDITPVVSLGFSPALPSELASQAALAATLQVSSTFTATNQHAPVGASVVLSDATRLELTAADGVRLVSDDAEVIEVQGLALVVRSQVQTASVPVLDASWSSGACAAQPIISRAVPVSLSLPTVASIAASTERTVLAAPDSAAAAAPFMHASSTPVLLTATLTGGARLDLDETDSLDIVSPSELAVTETSTGLLVTVASGAAPGVYHAMVTYETASTNISISVVDVAALHVTCRLHANGHTSQAEAGVVASLAPFQGLSPATFQACAVDVRGVLSTDGGATAVQTTDDVAASATISAVSGALAVTGTIVSVASPTSPVLGQAAVDVSVVGVTTQLTLTVSSTPVSVASATLTFPSQLRGLAQTTSVTPEAAVTFSDSSVFDSAAVLPAGLVEFMLEEPAPLGATGASASLLSAATGEVRLLGNSVERLSLFLVTVDATSPVVLAEASFACNLLPAEGEVDFGVNSGLALSGATAGSLLSFEVRANAGSADIDRLVFDVLFNASLVDFVTAGAGSDFVGAVNAFSSTLPQEEQAAFATHFVRVTAEPNAGVSGVPHIATITFTVKADTADEQVFFAGRVAAFTSRAGGAIAVGASESTPIVSPAASISTVIEAPSVMNRRRRRRRRDVATTACPTPPCAVCPNGDTHQTGDVNADCVFTLDDVTFFMDAYLETLLDPNYFSTLLPVQQEQLDADQDGTIGVLDVDLLSRVLSKDVRFVRDVMVQPVDTSNGCRLEVAVRVFGAGNVPALPGSTHVFFDVESMSAGFDTLFDASVVEVGQRINVDKGSSSLQGGLWQAAHLGGDVYGVVVRTPIASEDMHGITVFQLTSVNTTSGSGGFVGVSTDALSFTWSGPRVPPFNFAGYDFELTVPTMPPFQFVRTAGYNPFATFTNEQATASCHATTSCTASEYETAAPTATSSAECMPISTCDAEEYETEAPTATTDRECVNRTVCNVPVEYQSSAGNATADRTCTNVTVCLEGEIALLEPTPTSDRVCRLDAPCDYNMYESVPLTLTTDRVCLPVSECDPGFEETAAPTATSDRECSLIDYCANDPCQNNATCVSSTQLLTFVCNCPPGFTGTMCEYADACGLLGDQNPCAPGSQCVNDAGGIRCECALGQACGCCDGFTFLSCSLQTLPDTGSYCSDPATVAEDLDNLQSRQQQQSSATGESLGIIVGGVLGGLALLVLAVLAVTSLRRRSRDKSEALVKYEQDPFSGMLTSMRNPVFAPASQYLAAFKRVVCFSFLRYNKDLVLTEPAEELGTVYDILMVPRPPKRTLPTLKDDTNMFMEAKVSENERSLDEVVDFLSLALADLVMEEAIDTAAKEQSNGTRPYRANVPNDASGLIPKRWAAYLDPITGQVEEPAYEDASLLRGEFEDDEFAVDGSVSPLTFAQAERFLARRVTMRKSQMQRGGARDNAFVYDMGAFSGDDDNDETYSTANMGDEPERMYDVGSSDGFGEPVYDEGDGEGGVQDTYAFASNPAALDDLEDFADEEATYDMADADTQNAVRRGKSKKEIEAMYSRANKASVREPNYDNAAPGMPGEHDDDDYDSANNLGLSDEEEDGGPDYDNTLPSGTYDVRTMLTSGLNDDGDDDGAEPQYLGGNGSRRRGSEPEPVYDQGDGDVLGALPSFDEPDYDLGNEAPGAEESGERDPAYDMATAEGDSAGDTTGLMNTDPDYDIGDAPAQEEEGLVSELFDDEEEHEPTYAFSQPRNTSVRPRALRSLHGRTRPESLDGSSI